MKALARSFLGGLHDEEYKMYSLTFLFHSEPPEIGPFSFSKAVMNEGDFAQISCIVTSGDRPLSISWSFHGENLAPHGSANGITTSNLGGRMSMLVIEQVKHTHQGNYTCQASNQAGTRSHTAQLIVNGNLEPVFG